MQNISINKDALFLNDKKKSKSFLCEYNTTITQLKEYKTLMNNYKKNHGI